MFGYTRNMAVDEVSIYKLIMDFEEHSSTVTKGKQPISTSSFLSSMKDILTHPEILLSNTDFYCIENMFLKTFETTPRTCCNRDAWCCLR